MTHEPGHAVELITVCSVGKESTGSGGAALAATAPKLTPRPWAAWKPVGRVLRAGGLLENDFRNRRRRDVGPCSPQRLADRFGRSRDCWHGRPLRFTAEENLRGSSRFGCPARFCRSIYNRGHDAAWARLAVERIAHRERAGRRVVELGDSGSCSGRYREQPPVNISNGPCVSVSRLNCWLKRMSLVYRVSLLWGRLAPDWTGLAEVVAVKLLTTHSRSPFESVSPRQLGK